MRIEKQYSNAVPNGKILNMSSTSQTDTYSCKKIEDKFDEEVGELANLETTDKSNVVNAINEVNNKLNKEINYSTEEQVVGKWINGKNLYRNIIKLSNGISCKVDVWTILIDNISTLNIETLTECKLINESGCVWSGFLTSLVDNKLQIYNGTAQWIAKTIILEYTKTTD